MTGWMIVVNYMMPIALLILIILSIPLPNYLIKYRNKFLITIGEVRIPYTDFNILIFFTSIAILLFTISLLAIWKHSKNIDIEVNNLLLNNPRCTRWRAERNFWISACNLVMYWSIYIIYSTQNTVINLHNKIYKSEETILDLKTQLKKTK